MNTVTSLVRGTPVAVLVGEAARLGLIVREGGADFVAAVGEGESLPRGVEVVVRWAVAEAAMLAVPQPVAAGLAEGDRVGVGEALTQRETVVEAVLEEVAALLPEAMFEGLSEADPMLALGVAVREGRWLIEMDGPMEALTLTLREMVPVALVEAVNVILVLRVNVTEGV